MKKMSKMKKGLVGLTAAAMLAGSCVAGPAFADDLNQNTKSAEVEFTVSISDAYTVTVPTGTTVYYDASTDGINLGNQLKGTIAGKHKIDPNKKLQLKIGYKEWDDTQKDYGSKINYDGTIKFQHIENTNKIADDTVTVNLYKDETYADAMNEGIIVTSDAGTSDNKEKGIFGKQDGTEFQNGQPKYQGDYVAKVVFSIGLVDKNS